MLADKPEKYGFEEDPKVSIAITAWQDIIQPYFPWLIALTGAVSVFSFFSTRLLGVGKEKAHKMCIRDSLKTFNTKKGIGHDDWVLEDVKTINLDLIAQKKGYTGYSLSLIHILFQYSAFSPPVCWG